MYAYSTNDQNDKSWRLRDQNEELRFQTSENGYCVLLRFHMSAGKNNETWTNRWLEWDWHEKRRKVKTQRTMENCDWSKGILA